MSNLKRGPVHEEHYECILCVVSGDNVRRKGKFSDI